MGVSQQILDNITELAKRHQVIVIGEIHGVKENSEILLEVYTALKSKYSILVGLEYPQSLIDDPTSAPEVVLQDGRFSPIHREVLEQIKQDNTQIFGFDLDESQLDEQKNQPLDWRDKIMAKNINEHISALTENQKLLLVTGDMHYQTKSQTIMYPDRDGVMKPLEYLPMGSQLKVSSILAIHLRYLSGQFYNFKLRQMPRIDVNKNISFRENDDVIEMDINEANPTI